MPATVISRTQRFDFRRISVALIVSKLTRIVEAEGATADADALDLVAQLADGGMRDAESLLDQVLAYAGDRINADAVREAVGLADESEISALLDAYLAGDAPAALDRIEALADVGRDMGQVAAQAEAEARRRLLRSASDPLLARRLAGMLRTLAEAATVGAREGRARLALELLAVEAPPALVPIGHRRRMPSRAPLCRPTGRASTPGSSDAPSRQPPGRSRHRPRPKAAAADPGAGRRSRTAPATCRASVGAGAMSWSAPRRPSSRSCESAARSPSTEPA